jgi:hypothetical protein
MATRSDPDPRELFDAFRDAVIRWLDRAGHLTPGEGFELGMLVNRLESELMAVEGGDLVSRRMALIGEVQLRLVDVKAPETLVSEAGHLKGMPVRAAPAAPRQPVEVPPLVALKPVADASRAVRKAASRPAPKPLQPEPAPMAFQPERPERVAIVRPAAPHLVEPPSEPWKRVPLKRLARAVPSARIAVDPIDMGPPPGGLVLNPK